MIFSTILDIIFRIWFYIFDRLILYPLLGWLIPTLGVRYFNLGYLPNEEPCDSDDIEMKQVVEEYSLPEDEERAHYYLYEKPLSLHPQYPELNGVRILEVGCGLGNGIKWIKRAHPFIGCIKGVDSVVMDEQPYITKGKADNLPFPSSFFDVVLNVESSHLYEDCPRFFQECERVLKPGGFVCWTDLRYTKDVSKVREQVKKSGLSLEAWRDITQNVLHGIHSTTKHYDSILDKAPTLVKMFSSSLRATYCAPGTHTYERFKRREKSYFAALWRKNTNTTAEEEP